MQALVISLSETPRTLNLLGALRHRGFRPRLVDALDGKGLTESEVRTIAVPVAGRLLYGEKLSSEQIGCHISHRRAYQEFLESQDEWILIVEDDAFPLDGLVQLRCWVENKRLAAPTVIECYSAGRVNIASSRNLIIGPNISLQPLQTYPGFAVGYFINRKAAALAAASPSIVAARADWPPWAVSVQFWRSIPNAISHGEPGAEPLSTMPRVNRTESGVGKVMRWAGLLSGVTFLRLKKQYPGGLREYYGHAVTPSYLYWRSKLLGRRSFIHRLKRFP